MLNSSSRATISSTVSSESNLRSFLKEESVSMLSVFCTPLKVFNTWITLVSIACSVKRLGGGE